MGREAPEYWSDPKHTAEIVCLRQMVEENLEPFERAKHFSELGGIVIESREISGNNGNQPTTQPYHWLCGMDRKTGMVVDPPDITQRDHPIHFIDSDAKLHGALGGHPLVADVDDWATPAWINFRAEAIAAAKPADQVEIVSTTTGRM
ncbi:hypothetical protein JXA59_02500 [Patescibacteria group bacterium]|nr:hypothetical protein [Patescibacteria group bacterium]